MTLIAQRRKILRQIDKYSEKRCERCLNATARDNDIIKCGCDAAIRVRRLGNRLMKLTNPRKDEATELMKTLFVPENLTPELYARLKYLKVMDKDITKKIGIRYGAFPNWKRENGIKSKYERDE